MNFAICFFALATGMLSVSAAEAAAKPDEIDRLIAPGVALLADENPESSEKAAISYFYPALRKDIKNPRARALLASRYLRHLSTKAHTREDYDSVRSFLLTPTEGEAAPAESVAALAEYLLFVQRPDEAAMLLDSVLDKRPDAELYHQRARAALVLASSAEAKAFAAKGIVPESMGSANPRHLLFYFERCEGEEAAAVLDRLGREFPQYQPYRLARARQLVTDGSEQEAIKLLQGLLEEKQISPILAREAKLLRAEAELLLGNPANAVAITYDSEDPRFIDLHVRAAGATSGMAKVYGHLKNAWRSEQEGKFEAAINDYVKAAELDRSYPFPFRRLAEMHRRLGTPELAMQREKTAWSSPLKPLAAALALAHAHLSRFELKEAGEVLAKACAKAGKASAPCQYAFGRLAELKHDQKAAEQYFSAALRGKDRPAELYLRMGARAAEKKDDDLAEFYYAHALAERPFDEQASLGLALSRFNLSGPSSAQAFLQRQLAQDPKSASLLTNAAILHLRGGDQLAGKNSLQNAIRSDARYSRAFFLLGDLTKEEGDRQSDYSARRHAYRYALACYEMYSKLNPGDVNGYLATANLYFDIRDLGAAAKNFHKVLELVPNHPDARLRLAQIARNGGEAERATELLIEELRVNPYSDAAHVELGNIAIRDKNFEVAEKQFQNAIDANYKNTDAHFGLGVVYHLNEEYEKGLKCFAAVIALDPLKADVYWQIGLIQQKRKHLDKAVKAFESYLALVKEVAAQARAEEKIQELNRDRDPIVVAAEETTKQLQAQVDSMEEPSIFERLNEANRTLLMRGFEAAKNSAQNVFPIGEKKTVANRFVEFQVPADFQCALVKDAFLCQSADQQKRRDAFISVVAYEAKPGRDELPVYQAQLEKPFEYQSLSGETITSGPRYSRPKEIFGQPWIEALHLNSELPDYVTRYFATRVSGIGVLVSFSVRQDKYQESYADLEAVAGTVKVFGDNMALKDLALRGSFGTAAAKSLQEKKATELLPALAGRGSAPDAEIEARYQALLESFHKRSFTEMLEHANFVLTFREDYKDTLFYQTIALRGVNALQEAAQQESAQKRQANLKKEVLDLEAQGLRLSEEARKDEKAKQGLEAVKQELYRRDPLNRAPASWGAPVEAK